MSKKANPAIIGGFIVGAVALAVIGVLVFGSGRFLTEKIHYVMYFDGSVKGLNVGAPVKFRGVKIGQVTDISIIALAEKLSLLIKVVFEIEPGRVSSIGQRLTDTPEEAIDVLVVHGLRAQLKSQSFVTGLLEVELDFYPDKPIELIGLESKYPEFPTIPSRMEELTKTLENLPIKDLVKSAHEAVEGINQIVNAPEVMESVRALRGTLAEARKLVKNIDGRVDSLAVSIEDAAQAAHDALAQIEETTASIKNATSEDSKLVYELTGAFEAMTDAAYTLRAVADYIERHPESLLRGKKTPKGD